MYNFGPNKWRGILHYIYIYSNVLLKLECCISLLTINCVYICFSVKLSTYFIMLQLIFVFEENNLCTTFDSITLHKLSRFLNGLQGSRLITSIDQRDFSQKPLGQWIPAQDLLRSSERSDPNKPGIAQQDILIKLHIRFQITSKASPQMLVLYIRFFRVHKHWPVTSHLDLVNTVQA